jgi:hypothetical protein
MLARSMERRRGGDVVVKDGSRTVRRTLYFPDAAFICSEADYAGDARSLGQ